MEESKYRPMHWQAHASLSMPSDEMTENLSVSCVHMGRSINGHFHLPNADLKILIVTKCSELSGTSNNPIRIEVQEILLS